MACPFASRAHLPPDKSGRLIVNPDLSVPGYPNLFVIGDLAHYAHQTGMPLLGLAPVAMQQGHYVARVIRARLRGRLKSAILTSPHPHPLEQQNAHRVSLSLL
jgi:NADH dehydrogenase FAD-containing subunit